MTALDQIIRSRYSCRSYDPARPVSRADLRSVVEAARLAPSACNSQTWRFIVVTDRVLRERICDEAMRAVVGNPWLRDAPAVIAGASELDFTANRLGRAVTDIDYYQVDLGIAMEHMALKAAEMGLATCWIGWFKEKKIREILDIPGKIRVSALLALGYPKEKGNPEKVRKPLEKIAFLEKWDRPFKA